MTRVLKRAFWNGVARKILRPEAKVMPVLQNSARSGQTSEKLTANVRPSTLNVQTYIRHTDM